MDGPNPGAAAVVVVDDARWHRRMERA
jgi:hypothetical protein